VRRVLKRYQAGGPEAVPHRPRPGQPPHYPPSWEAELVRVADCDPHEVGVDSALWTCRLLADYLTRVTGHRAGIETVRIVLHRAGWVCKRPRWVLTRKAQAQPGWAKTPEGRGAAGRRGRTIASTRMRAGPRRHPCRPRRPVARRPAPPARPARPRRPVPPRRGRSCAASHVDAGVVAPRPRRPAAGPNTRQQRQTVGVRAGRLARRPPGLCPCRGPPRRPVRRPPAAGCQQGA